MASSPNAPILDGSVPLTVEDLEELWDLLFPRIYIDSTFGAVLLGTLAGLTLFGLSLNQSYQYFRLYPADRPLFKCMVVTILILGIVHTILDIHICYHYLVSKFFDPQGLLTGVWSLNLLSLNIGATMFVAQSFFAHRVLLIGSVYRWLSATAAVLLICELAFATAVTAETFIQPTFHEFFAVSWLIKVGYAMAVGADIVISAALLSVVRRNRRGVKREESILDIAVVYFVNTGVSNCLLSICSLVLVAKYDEKLIYVGFNIISARLYANWLLAVLNSRRSDVDRGAEGFETGSLGLTVTQKRQRKKFAKLWNNPQTKKPSESPVIDIVVTTEIQQEGRCSTRTEFEDSGAVSDEMTLKGPKLEA